MAEKKEKKTIMEVNDEEDRKKSLEAVIGVIEKTYGKGSIMKLGEKPKINIDVIPTGSLTLDLALGVGGYPRAGLSKYTAPSPRVKPQLRCTLSRRRRSAAATLRSLTRSTRSTQCMQRLSAWISTIS